MSAPLIVIVGSLNADLVVRVPRFPRPGETLTGFDFGRYPGGKGANQAYGVARLGGEALMIGQVGADDYGTWLTRHLAAGGVDTSGVCIDRTATTGLALITVSDSGQNEIVLVPGANGTFTEARLTAPAPRIARAGVVLLQLEIPLPTVLAAARAGRAAGALVIVDPAPAQDVPRELFSLADYVTPNETELAALTGGGEVQDLDDLCARAARLRGLGAKAVFVKWGDRGAVLVDGSAHRAWAAHDVSVVDTTAAGDAFNAALAVALAGGADVEAAGRFANAAAAVSTTRAGAQPGMPVHAEVEALLGTGIPRALS